MIATLPQPPSLAHVFYQGRCAEVLAETVDKPFGVITPETLPLIVGALSFLGRTSEAEWRYESALAELDPEGVFACRFYLGVGFTRASHYQKARTYFSDNLRALRASSDATARLRFFAWQGAGFYYHFRGRYRQALQAAEKALEAAVRSDFFFGRMLASDLVAHARIESGEIARGLSELEMAHRLAHGLGHGSYEKAIFRAIVCYRAQYGLAPHDIINALRELIQEAKVQDSYTDNYLHLELARQLTLRGQLRDAELCLLHASRSIYATQHRRQRVQLNLRWAEISYQRRDAASVSEKLQLALADLDPNVDLALHLQCLGLASKAQCPGLPYSAEEIAGLTRRVGSGWARRIASRRGIVAAFAPAPADDPLGDLLDSLKPGAALSSAAVERNPSLVQEYLGLLAPLLPEAPSERVIYLHLAPRCLLLFDRGDMRVLESAQTPKMLDLLRALGRSKRSKGDLVEAVWGYSYHPLRHDTLLYTLISRLRAALGAYADWLENTPHGYELMAGVSIFAAPAAPEDEEEAASSSLFDAVLETRPSDGGALMSSLNSRQIGIINHLKAQPWIDIEACSQLFATSKVTATRDLAALVRSGLLLKVGKGRATRYTRAPQRE